VRETAWNRLVARKFLWRIDQDVHRDSHPLLIPPIDYGRRKKRSMIRVNSWMIERFGDPRIRMNLHE
jgi:hypothetical protein